MAARRAANAYASTLFRVRPHILSSRTPPAETQPDRSDLETRRSEGGPNASGRPVNCPVASDHPRVRPNHQRTDACRNRSRIRRAPSLADRWGTRLLQSGKTVWATTQTTRAQLPDLFRARILVSYRAVRGTSARGSVLELGGRASGQREPLARTTGRENGGADQGSGWARLASRLTRMTHSWSRGTETIRR